MGPEPNLEDLKGIRSLMERSSMYRSLSGLSGVAAGAIGMIVYFIVYGIVDPMVEKQPEMKFTDEGQLYLIKIFFIASLICLLLVFAAIFFFSWRNAKNQDLPFPEPAMQKMFINLFIPLIAGGVYCLMLIQEKQFLLIAPSMLIFYGLAMINASRHTIIEIRYLGLVELILGLIAIFFKEYGIWFWLAGFGVVNLIYGAYIYFSYEHKPIDSK
jgi:hypothetical protein